MSTWSHCLVLQLLPIVNGGGGSGVQSFVTAERVNVVISCLIVAAHAYLRTSYVHPWI